MQAYELSCRADRAAVKNCRDTCYVSNIIVSLGSHMIKTFKCKETLHIWHGKVSRKFPLTIQARALRKLRQINAATCLDDLKNPPGNRLENLSGRRKDQMSTRVSDQWRICFEWKNNQAYDVEIIDYH